MSLSTTINLGDFYQKPPPLSRCRKLAFYRCDNQARTLSVILLSLSSIHKLKEARLNQTTTDIVINKHCSTLLLFSFFQFLPYHIILFAYILAIFFVDFVSRPVSADVGRSYSFWAANP